MDCRNTRMNTDDGGGSFGGLATKRRKGLKFLRANFGQMNAMCERGGMFERLIYERTQGIFEYFEMPFDSPAR